MDIPPVPEPIVTAGEATANDDDGRLTLDNVIFAGSGHKHCVICRRETSAGMVVMPKSARLDLLILHSTYAPHGVRFCSFYLLTSKHLSHDTQVNMENRQRL